MREDRGLILSRRCNSGQVLSGGGQVQRTEAFGSDVYCAGLYKLCHVSKRSVCTETWETYSAAQIVNQIISILNTDTQPDNVLGHVALPSGLLVDGRVAHAARHTDERIHTTERDADGPELGALDNALRHGDIASLEGEHGTCTAGHAPVQVILRVRLQARVADLEAVRLEEGSDAHSVRLLLLHADTERLDAAEEQPGVKGRETAAGGVDGKVESVAQRRVVDGDDTGHEVVVSGQVLCAGFVDNVGAEVEGVHQHGRHHGVVYADDGGGVRVVGHACDGGDVADLDQRVGGCLEQDQRRLAADDLAHGLWVGRVYMVHDDAAVRREVLEQSVCSAVQVVAGHDLVARPQQAGDDVEGAHAGADDKGAVRVHDLGQMALEVGSCRVAGARVVIFAAAAARAGLLEGGRLYESVTVIVVSQQLQSQLQLRLRLQLLVWIAAYLVDGHGAGIVLVGALGVDQLCGEGILPACTAGCAWRRRRRQVVAVNVDDAALALGAFASHCCCCCAADGRTVSVRVVAVRCSVFLQVRCQ